MSKRVSRKDLQSRLDMANRTVCLQIDAIRDLGDALADAEYRVVEAKALAFDMLAGPR